MKKLLSMMFMMLVLALVLPGLALAETTWYPANGSTLAWDMDYTATKPDGTAFTIPAEEITFRVYRVLSTNTDKTAPELLTVTPTKTHLVTFAEEGQYILGVQAVRTVPGVEGGATSAIAWSDAPEATRDNPFGVVFVIPPAAPVGILVE